ncbi:hypothetical protein RCH18_001844 [Flavobacterium sp. PL11]|nr:hypothetical protein [Flavobacterium sp. PL11]
MNLITDFQCNKNLLMINLSLITLLILNKIRAIFKKGSVSE